MMDAKDLVLCIQTDLGNGCEEFDAREVKSLLTRIEELEKCASGTCAEFDPEAGPDCCEHVIEAVTKAEDERDALQAIIEITKESEQGSAIYNRITDNNRDLRARVKELEAELTKRSLDGLQFNAILPVLIPDEDASTENGGE